MDLILGDVININGTLGCIIAQPQDLQYLVITKTHLLDITTEGDIITVTNNVNLSYIQERLSELAATVVGHIDLQ